MKTTSNIRDNTFDAKLLKESSLIIWDEATMAPHYALSAVDKLLKGLTKSSTLFGGKVILLGGDFRQCLPVVRHGTKVSIIQSSLKYFSNWKNFEQLSLVKNIRSTDEKFSKWLLTIGEGSKNNDENLISIHQSFLTEEPLIDAIFGNQTNNIKSLAKRAILCPTNKATFEINDEIVDHLGGNEKTNLSIDTIESENEDERLAYPVELLNTLIFSGLPPHKLTLKVGCIIMLL